MTHSAAELFKNGTQALPPEVPTRSATGDFNSCTNLAAILTNIGGFGQVLLPIVRAGFTAVRKPVAQRRVFVLE